MDPALRTQGFGRTNGQLGHEDVEPEESDELWPLRTRPCRGELFSSWLVRVARCYDMPVQNFCRQVWPGQDLWRGDIDRQIKDDALQFLSRKTGIAFDELFSMTLRAHEQHACPSSGDDDSARDLYFHLAELRHEAGGIEEIAPVARGKCVCLQQRVA
jgi:hypothetical protein